MEKQVVNLTIFLIKEHITDLKDCLKAPDTLSSSNIKHEYGMEGTIFYCDSKRKPPRWKAYLETLSERSLDISDNASNKAILLVRIEHRIMAVVFGYGRSFLKEDCIERNFGFKVALNTINPNKMRSVNAATIEDMVVTTQRQASYSTTQDEFGLNITNDIMKGITGEPYDIRYGSHISGKDSLVVAVFMDLSELKDKLLLYYTAYSDNRYKRIFGGIYEWAGEFRTINIMKREDILGGDTVRYAQPENIKKQLDMSSKEISKLKYSEDPKTLLFKIVRITAAIWQTHPFREGNTRAVIAFSVLLAAKMGIELDYDLFAEHAAYVRNALVWCTQGMYSKYEYLENIYYDAAGLLNDEPETEPTKAKDYSVLGDYHVSNYQEQPHVYADSNDTTQSE